MPTGRQQFNEVCRLTVKWLIERHGFVRAGPRVAVREGDVRCTVGFDTQSWSSAAEMSFLIVMRMRLGRLDPGDVRFGAWEATHDMHGPQPNQIWPKLTTESPRDPGKLVEGEVIPAVQRMLDRYEPLLSDPWALYRTVRFDDEAMTQPFGLWPASPVGRLELAAVFAAALGSDQDVDDIVEELPQAAADLEVSYLVPDVLDTVARAWRGEFLVESLD